VERGLAVLVQIDHAASGLHQHSAHGHVAQLRCCEMQNDK
jgi:hypothetical protein